MLRIQTAFFVVGATIRDNVIIRAAGDIAYMKGWSVEQARAFCRERGWVCDYIPTSRLLPIPRS